jgi:SLOG family YspA-like protein
MKVLVCGGRKYADRERVFATLDDIDRTRGPISGVVHGASGKQDKQGNAICGADLLGRDWQRERMNAPKHEMWLAAVPALWTQNGMAAGPIRNQHMLDRYKPQLVVAFPGGAGTADMVRRAKAAGVEVIEINGA